MLVQRDELSERRRCQLFQQNRIGRSVSLEHAMRNGPIGRPLPPYFVSRLAKCERFTLSEDVREQHVVLLSKSVECLVKGDEVAGNETGALVNELVERMLTVGPRLTPVDRTGVVAERIALERDVLAVALHRQLLEICREPFQVLLVRQHRYRLRAKEVIVPDGEQPHQHRQVALERRGAEMLVNLMEAAEHGAKVVRADGKHRRESDR